MAFNLKSSIMDTRPSYKTVLHTTPHTSFTLPRPSCKYFQYQNLLPQSRNALRHSRSLARTKSSCLHDCYNRNVSCSVVVHTLYLTYLNVMNLQLIHIVGLTTSPFSIICNVWMLLLQCFLHLRPLLSASTWRCFLGVLKDRYRATTSS